MRYLLFLAFTLFLLGCGDVATTETPTATTLADGTVDINPLNDPTPLSDMITFDGIGPGAQLISPYTLKGKASGAWFSKHRFPVAIVHEDGSLIASSPGMATGKRTQAGWVPYESRLAWIAGPGTKAKLVITLSNPTDAEEGRSRRVEMGVVLR